MGSQGVAVQPRSAPIEVIRFGQQELLEVEASTELTFPQGIVGMSELRRFALVEDERIAPCSWLQSLEEPGLAFIVVNPDLLVPDYNPEIGREEARQLQLARAAEADVWAIVTVRPDPTETTLNLLAPVIINRQARLGRQVILDDDRYSIRHPVVGAAQAGQSEGPSEVDGAGVAGRDSRPGENE
jgi:flagellar assembly factor FliW